ncbi:MAG TPA: hypothetical protein VGP76_00480 [Planctomycetaceae bacterium]|jgi:hypothetical protein|nr:hypothetical protein [Planctomycetaceae bacterium]
MRRSDFYLSSADELSDTTGASPFNQWAVGVGVAAAIALYALYCFWTGTAILPGGRPMYRVIHLQGLAARAVASGWLSLAAFVHLHWFWTASPRFWAYAQLGKIVAAAAIVASLAVLAYAMLMLS